MQCRTISIFSLGGADPKTENDDIDYDVDYETVETSDESDSNDTNTETGGVNGHIEVNHRSRSEISDRSEVNGDIVGEEGSEGSTGSESEGEDMVERDHRGHGLTPSDFVGNNEKVAVFPSTHCILGNFSCFLLSADFFFQI